ncbi:hypothetical protein D3C83_198310 [compost metagenome]
MKKCSDFTILALMRRNQLGLDQHISRRRRAGVGENNVELQQDFMFRDHCAVGLKLNVELRLQARRND